MSGDQAPDLRRTPAERAASAVLPASGAAWTAAEALHLAWSTGATDVGISTVILAALAWGASGRWGRVPGWLAPGIAMAGGWLAAAAAEGPLHWWPYAPLTWAWAAASVWARR